MPISFPFENLDERERVLGAHYNSIVTALTAFFDGGLGGADLEAPIVLGKAGQNLDGDGKYIHSFSRWFGGTSAASVKDVTGFGATGDGSTDDIEAIMDAIDDMPSTGGILFFPPGIYVVGKAIQMMGRDPKHNRIDGVTIAGAGRSSVIKVKTGSDVTAIEMGQTARDMLVTNIRINGNKAGQSTGFGLHGISAENTWNCLITGCWIDFIQGVGIEVRHAINLTISNCFINGTTKAGIRHHTGGERGDGLIINACTINTPGDPSNAIEGEGIRLIPCPRKTVISGCTVEDSWAGGIIVGTSDSQNCDNISITGNTVTNAGRGLGTVTAVGITVTSPSAGIRAGKITITGNFVETSDTDGIRIESSNGGEIQGFTVSSNVVVNNDENGIKIVRATHGSICANSVQNNGQDAGGSSREGIRVEGGTDDESQYLAITGNGVFDSDGTPTQQIGIHTLSTSKDCTVAGNATQGNAVQGILDEGIDNDIAHNTEDPT